MRKGPKLFSCPKCRETYLGHDPVPDCPRCGYDYREGEAFRWDVLVYFLAILGLMGFLFMSSFYRGGLGWYRMPVQAVSGADGERPEKLPGGGGPRPRIPSERVRGPGR